MKQAWDALGRFSQDNPWLIPTLALASSAGTFLLAGLVVALTFMAVLFLVLFLAALHSIGNKRSPKDGDPATGDLPALEVSATPEAVERGADTQDEMSVMGEAGSSATPKVDEGEQEDEQSPIHRAFQLAFSGDLDAVREIYASELAKASTDEEEVKCRALHEFLLVKAGDPQGIPRLKAMVDDSRAPLVDVLGFYASALSLMGEVELAVESLVTRADVLSADDRAAALLQAARMLSDSDQEERAADLVAPMAEATDVKDSHRAEALRIVAESKQGSSALDAMAAYERSLLLDPTSSRVRFALAYLYSEHEFFTLAHHHYSVLEETSRASAVGLNNLGVAEARLNAPGRAFEHYRKAGEAGSALGWANLSHALLNVGAMTDAELAIEKGEQLDSSDPRLIAARERLASMREQERENLANAKKTVANLRERVLSSAKAMAPNIQTATGQWELSTGALVQLAMKDGKLSGIDPDSGWRLELSREGDGYVAQIRPGKYASDEHGYMYLEDDASMVILIPNPSSAKVPAVLTARRVEGVSATN